MGWKPVLGGDGLFKKDSEATLSGVYLKTDQSEPQTVENGAPTFDSGLNSNDHLYLKAGKRLYFDG